MKRILPRLQLKGLVTSSFPREKQEASPSDRSRLVILSPTPKRVISSSGRAVTRLPVAANAGCSRSRLPRKGRWETKIQPGS